MLRSLLRPVWRYRHHLVHNTKSLFGWTFQTIGQLPIPPYVKQAVHDMTMLSLDHMVIHTDAYRTWQSQRSGTSRIQHFMNVDMGDKDSQHAPHPKAPGKKDWDRLSNDTASYAEDATLDVIIPIYKGYDQSLNALYCAIETRKYNAISYNIIVMNDASPDPELTASLETLAQTDMFELRMNDTNLGFVKTVNKGMAAYDNHDIILLNSDTEVYHNWCDRIVAAAQSSEKIATVTPLSNNAEICSYPYFVQDNNMALEIDFPEIDQLCARTNKNVVIDVPTGVGFCMYISRLCLQDIGAFDEETFGKGYGEENDFCRRAAADGWRNLMACDVFVRHIGGTSFGASKKKLVTKGYDALLKKHPDYGNHVKEFLAHDPVAPYRHALDVQRVRSALHTKNILMVSHTLGGGTARHVDELCNALNKERIGSLILEPALKAPNMITLRHSNISHTPSLSFSMEYDRGKFIKTLQTLGIIHIHIHHLVTFPVRIADFLSLVAKEMNIAYDMTLHDYYTVCPRINFVNHTHRYCGEPDIAQCEQCITSSPSHAGAMPVWQWRMEWERFLANARHAYVPSEDIATRIKAYYACDNIHVRPHVESYEAPSFTTAKKQSEPLRIAVIGALSKTKGSQVLVDCIKDANHRNLDIEFIVIGHSDHPNINAGMKRLHVSGAYEENDMQSLIQQYRPHFIWIPSVWPETYCYTLSIAWRFSIKPIVFDLGAQAARIQDLGDESGHIIPFSLCDEPKKINDLLLSYSVPEIFNIKPEATHYTSYFSDYYRMTQNSST